MADETNPPRSPEAQEGDTPSRVYPSRVGETAVLRLRNHLSDHLGRFATPQEALEQLLTPHRRELEYTNGGDVYAEMMTEDPPRDILWMILEAAGPLVAGSQKEGSLCILPLFSNTSAEVVKKLSFIHDWDEFVGNGKIIPLSRIMARNIPLADSAGPTRTCFVVVLQPNDSRLAVLKASAEYKNGGLVLLYRDFRATSGEPPCWLEASDQHEDINATYGDKTIGDSFGPLIDELSKHTFAGRRLAYYVGYDLNEAGLGRINKVYAAFGDTTLSVILRQSTFGMRFFRAFGSQIQRSITGERYWHFIKTQRPALALPLPQDALLKLLRAHDPENAFTAPELPAPETALSHFTSFHREPDLRNLLEHQYDEGVEGGSSQVGRAVGGRSLACQLIVAKLVAFTKRDSMLCLFDLLHYANAAEQAVQIRRLSGDKWVEQVVKDPWELLKLLSDMELITSKRCFSVGDSEASHLQCLGEFLEELELGASHNIVHIIEVAGENIIYTLQLRFAANRHKVITPIPNLNKLMLPAYGFFDPSAFDGLPPDETLRKSVRAVARFFGNGGLQPRITLHILDGPSASADCVDGVNIIFRRSSGGTWLDAELIARGSLTKDDGVAG